MNNFKKPTITFKDLSTMRIELEGIDCNKCRNKKEGYFCSKCFYEPMNLVDVEPLTDAEQRIFLAAIAREKKVCKQVDDEWQDSSESLVRICEEIERKVKGALWTI